MCFYVCYWNCLCRLLVSVLNLVLLGRWLVYVVYC